MFVIRLVVVLFSSAEEKIDQEGRRSHLRSFPPAVFTFTGYTNESATCRCDEDAQASAGPLIKRELLAASA